MDNLLNKDNYHVTSVQKVFQKMIQPQACDLHFQTHHHDQQVCMVQQ